jgi:hypothetical protein
MKFSSVGFGLSEHLDLAWRANPHDSLHEQDHRQVCERKLLIHKGFTATVRAVHHEMALVPRSAVTRM